MHSKYRIRKGDEVYAREFLANPVGHHSPGLRRVTNLLRGLPIKGKHVVVCIEPHKEWMLGVLPGERGKPIKLLRNKHYRDLLEAERDVFRLRWKQVTGRALKL